jgi:hypothetical protein
MEVAEMSVLVTARNLLGTVNSGRSMEVAVVMKMSLEVMVIDVAVTMTSLVAMEDAVGGMRMSLQGMAVVGATTMSLKATAGIDRWVYPMRWPSGCFCHDMNGRYREY